MGNRATTLAAGAVRAVQKYELDYGLHYETIELMHSVDCLLAGGRTDFVTCGNLVVGFIVGWTNDVVSSSTKKAIAQFSSGRNQPFLLLIPSIEPGKPKALVATLQNTVENDTLMCGSSFGVIKTRDAGVFYYVVGLMKPRRSRS